MGFPLNPATARGERKAEPRQGALPPNTSQVTSLHKAALGEPYVTQDCNLCCPSPCKGRGFVFRHGSQTKTPLRVLLPATSSSENTQCDHVTNVSFQYHLTRTCVVRCLGLQAAGRGSRSPEVFSKEPKTGWELGALVVCPTLPYLLCGPEHVTHPPE